MSCRIFYDETRPEPRGVQAIVQSSPAVGWYVESHGDYYLRDESGLWRAMDISGLKRHLQQRDLLRPQIGLTHLVLSDGEWIEVNMLGFEAWIDSLDFVLSGETLSNVRFQEIFQAALADADFGRKHGYLSNEIKP